MKIIVTGATGSAGAHLTRHFASQGHHVIATGKTKTPPKNLLKIAEYIQADITKPYELPDADICIHTAAYSDDKGKLKDLLPANELGTKHTAEATARCEIFIQISSSSVYLPLSEPLTENMAGRQNNKQLSAYGFSKLQAEEILKKTSKHNSCFILRPRAHYGIGDKVILPRLLKLVKNNTLVCPGDMNIKVSLTNYKNLAHAVDCCIKSDLTGFHTYNVSDDKVYILFDFIQKLTTSLYANQLPFKEVPVFILKLLAIFKINGITPLLVRSFTNDMVLDISKIKKELGYQAVTEFENELSDLCDWVNSLGGVDAFISPGKEIAWEV